VAIFVHGCFWHQHPGCREASDPHTNSEYWKPKLKRNVARDLEHEQNLKSLGYRVLVVWECQIEKDLDNALNAVIRFLKSAE